MASRSPASAGAASSSGQRVAGGSGSSDSDSLKSEVGRLSQENAHLSRKISEMLGKAPATPVASRSGSGQIGAGSGERVRFKFFLCMKRQQPNKGNIAASHP